MRALAAWAPGYQQGAWTSALAGLGVGAVPAHAYAPELAARFRAERLPHQTLFPEVTAVLQALRQQPQYALALLTNGAPDIQRDKIAGAGLAPYFAVIVVSGEVGVGKPDPRIYAHTLAALGVDAADATMIGDSLRNDIAGAQQSGLRAIWVRREVAAGSEPHVGGAMPDATIASLNELAALL